MHNLKMKRLLFYIFPIIVVLTSCESNIYKLESTCGTTVSNCVNTIELYSKEFLPEGLYESAEIELLKILPIEVFETSIEFKNYQFIDSCKLTRNYEWVVPRYEIKFILKQPSESIISNYCFQVSLLPNGKLIEQINLGNGFLENNDFNFLTVDEFSEIWDIERRNGMQGYTLGFDTLNQAIVISMNKYTKDGSNSILMVEKSKTINALNGEEIK